MIAIPQSAKSTTLRVAKANLFARTIRAIRPVRDLHAAAGALPRRTDQGKFIGRTVIETKHSVAEDVGEYFLRDTCELPFAKAIGQQGYASNLGFDCTAINAISFSGA
jgi:hypothetical protein